MDGNPKRFVVRVAIQRPIYKLLDYLCDSDVKPQLGCRVRVPLGNFSVYAIVVDTGVESEISRLKKVIDIIDEKPLLDASMLDLLLWCSQYYLYPIGEVLFHALPVALRKGKSFPGIRLWQANKRGNVFSIDLLSRAPKQTEMLLLLRKGEYSAQQLQALFGTTWRTILNQLVKKDLVDHRNVDLEYIEEKVEKNLTRSKPLSITAEQKDSIDSTLEFFQEDVCKPILLHGITGSGKTEVYLRVIAPLLKEGKQILVLVPEIGLTPQLLKRFKCFFPDYVCISLHSGLSETERLRAWLGARSGKVNIIIGTRSAIFTPMKNLGMIVVDEEHDASYKQQEGFLYHGRDLAIKRAHDENIPVLLGSATPSLESLSNVNRQRYHYLRLANRPGKSKRPEMVVQDTRTLILDAGISNLMMAEIRQHIDQEQQVLLFLNRRGFAPVLICSGCGWHATCPHCDNGMTYHASIQKVICHHCGKEQKVTTRCPDCGEEELTTQGQGTERIEHVLKTHFPEISVVRIDRDSTSKKGSLEKKLAEVHLGKPVILIGTQMLTKGHDFPKLTLVGILDVDQALFSIDFRAQERLAQQIIQVAGRAGRSHVKGRVVLQTTQPEHPLLLSLLSRGYYKTAQEILNERQLWSYPPFGAQALIRVSANSAEAGMRFLKQLYQKLEFDISSEVTLLGPMPSPLPKKANRYRSQLLLNGNNRGSLHLILHKALSYLVSAKKTGGVRWVIDVDPMDFL